MTKIVGGQGEGEEEQGAEAARGVPPVGRCFGDGDPLYARYHDQEWGRPRTDERSLFEKICLEGFQAGLSWLVVLRKRPALRAAFADFDPDAVAQLDVAPLLADARLIRSEPKLRACVTNARATVALRADGGLPALVWTAAGPAGPGTPAPASWAEVPASTPGSAALARDLKRRGFTFVGPTTVYSLLQACGIVDDHLAGCPVRTEVEQERAAVLAPWCRRCGDRLTAGGHAACRAAAALEPPRYCAQCRRRMVVQVLPGGWSARCAEHGLTTAG